MTELLAIQRFLSAHILQAAPNQPTVLRSKWKFDRRRSSRNSFRFQLYCSVSKRWRWKRRVW